jgi:hypothetical protein
MSSDQRAKELVDKGAFDSTDIAHGHGGIQIPNIYKFQRRCCVKSI